LRREGQDYKLQLERMVSDLGLQRNVVFHNRFVSDSELFGYLCAADIYITPYLHKEQLTSGTLAFAVGAGKAVVSTPYWAAQELLGDGRGKLVRFGDSKHLAKSISEILNNNSLFHGMRKLAYEYGRSRTWPKVGRTYWRLFNSHLYPMPATLAPRAASPNWKEPTYQRQQMYQSA
ncbi:MAG: glycosyltransferase, partial [Planctomycetota bacterium]